MANTIAVKNTVANAKHNVRGIQFETNVPLLVGAIEMITQGGDQIDVGFKMGTRAIVSMETYAAQQTAVKAMAGAYQKVRRALGDEIEIASAIRFVQRRVKKIAGDGFTWVKSDTPEAAKKRAARSKVAGATGTGKKLKTGTIAPAPAPAKTWHPNAWRSELIAAIKQDVESAAVVMAPSELQQLQSLLAAFTASLAAIPVPKAKASK